MILFVNAERKVAVTLMKTHTTECFPFNSIEDPRRCTRVEAEGFSFKAHFWHLEVLLICCICD